ncbi:MAG: DUF4330 domain-containing protein [Gomphosphaeria aponina SAG 52.96 = DSM 107014]|uniref:DUF4330 domain-containing protein n=1 Tax=Gomphosphaeria aponina SAG 52.96 = DSM 107014 TaxID=1521640 RepID=A0A941JVI8_9CHRO|nr:DUF4330 domain-containing protein [Gomphosphaeria aponina SAG 52.96 = DSM 107014]
MKILDSKGRLFGKVSVLDLGAGCVILLVLIGIFIVPGPRGSVAQVGSSSTQALEIDLLVRGLSVRNPQTFLQELQENNKTDIIIRNQPAGQVEIKSTQELPRTIPVPQPNGTVIALSDPRPEAIYSTDMIITLVGEGQVTDKGAVLANQKVKIGTSVELDGPNYNFRGSIIDVR